MVEPSFLRSHFSTGLSYDKYVASGSLDQQSKWNAAQQRVKLMDSQTAVLRSFVRDINVVVISGTWCGDCVHQVPMIDAISKVCPRIHVAYVDRDKHIDLSNQVKICGGNRVPTIIFANEDFDFLSIYGDKSLARLRATAVKNLGAACAVPGAVLATDEAGATLQDWVDQFERAHLIARLSTKLRERHGD